MGIWKVSNRNRSIPKPLLIYITENIDIQNVNMIAFSPYSFRLRIPICRECLSKNEKNNRFTIIYFFNFSRLFLLMNAKLAPNEQIRQ